MSAFLCSDLHTCIVAQLAEKYGLSCDAVATTVGLRAMNNAALKARYDGSAETLAGLKTTMFQASHWLAAHNPSAHDNVVNCLDYQCSEGDYETQPQYPLMQTLKAKPKEAANFWPESRIWSV